MLLASSHLANGLSTEHLFPRDFREGSADLAMVNSLGPLRSNNHGTSNFCVCHNPNMALQAILACGTPLPTSLYSHHPSRAFKSTPRCGLFSRPTRRQSNEVSPGAIRLCDICRGCPTYGKPCPYSCFHKSARQFSL